MEKSTAISSKKDEIINAALLLFSQKGYKSTSLIEIANHVGLRKTTLFHYFKNKEEVLIAIMEESLDSQHIKDLDEILSNKNLSGVEKFRLALERQVAVTCKYKDHINVYLTEIKSLSAENRERYDRKKKEFQRYFEKIIAEMQADNDSRTFKGLNSKIVAFGILGMCNWLVKWYNQNGPLRPKEIYQIFYSMLKNPAQTD